MPVDLLGEQSERTGDHGDRAVRVLAGAAARADLARPADPPGQRAQHRARLLRRADGAEPAGPVPSDQRRIWECRASAAFAARYSFTKPSPTDAAKMTPMIRASLRSPTKYDAAAVTASRIRSGDRIWRPRTRSPRARSDPTAFGPVTASRSAASASVSPVRLLARRASASSGVSDAASATARNPAGAGLRVPAVLPAVVGLSACMPVRNSRAEEP